MFVNVLPLVRCTTDFWTNSLIIHFFGQNPGLVINCAISALVSILNETKFTVEFSVRYDKIRGILIETICTDDDEYFFKDHDQPIAKHCVQMQRIVRTANIKSFKKIFVDIAEFSYEYFHNDTYNFKGKLLNSVKQQMEKNSAFLVNKQIGALKRSITVAANKSKKIEERNEKIATRMEAAELHDETVLARRMREVFGVGGAGGSAGGYRGAGEPLQVPHLVALVAPFVPEQQANDDGMDYELPDYDDDDL